MHLFFPLYVVFIVSPAGRWLLETCSRSGPSLQLVEALDLCFNPIEQMIWISDLSQPPQLTAFQRRDAHTDVKPHLCGFDPRVD